MLSDFDGGVFTYDGVTSRFYRRDGRYFVWTDGPDGAMREFEITHTFGWSPLQQYLIPIGRGRRQALGIAWDSRPTSAGGQGWFHLYPRERVTHDDVLHWTRPSQNWNDRCARCHSTHERHRGDRDLLVALVTINRDRGAIADARRHADALVALAPDDVSARRLRDELGR